jgi:hypothetical protein
VFFTGRIAQPRKRKTRETHTARMKARINTPEGRAQYAARFGVVEPVFGNLCYNKGLTRFTLRGRHKGTGSGSSFAWSTTSRSWPDWPTPHRRLDPPPLGSAPRLHHR